jgi:uncharacterized protein YcbK (DUF882 family)
LNYLDIYYTINFSYDEFASLNTREIMIMRQDFMYRLQKLRDIIGEPIHVSHGLRSWHEQFYEVCGGDFGKYYESEHQFGNAADIYLTDKSIVAMIRLALKAIHVGFTRIGFYPYSNSNFIHVDMKEPCPSESWIRNKDKTYTYFDRFDGALSEISLNDFAGNYV